VVFEELNGGLSVLKPLSASISAETADHFLLVGTQPTYQRRRLGGQTRVFVFFIWPAP
jgi:hypothetical protein